MKNNSVILLAKTIFQTTCIKLKLYYFNIFSGNKNPETILLKKLNERKFNWDINKSYKTFFICSINDWEVEMLNEFKLNSETYHFCWDKVCNFFESKDHWVLFQNNLNSRLLNEFESFYEDDANILVFIYASDFSIKCEVIEKLKRRNVLIISFCWDDILYFKAKVKGQYVGISKLSKVVDFNFTLSPEAIARYTYNNSPCFFWNSIKLDINSSPLNKNIIEKENFYVLFIGSNYGWRNRFINRLKTSGLDVKCYGSGWPNGRLTNKEMMNQVAKAPITLGFSNVGYTRNITSIKGRDFEIPYWKGLYITQFSSGLSFYYSIGEDVLTYKNLKECIEKIHFIKEHFDLAYKIRNNGFNKAVQNASWKSRFLFLNNFIYENILFKIK